MPKIIKFRLCINLL